MMLARLRRSPLGSIRFRLTAWYTLLLAGVLLVVALTVSALLERQLRGSVEDRLQATANEIGTKLLSNAEVDGSQLRFRIPRLDDPFAAQSQFIEVIDLDAQGRNEVSDQSSNLQGMRIPGPPITQDLRRPSFETVAIDGTALRVVRQPIVIGGETQAAIVVAESLAPVAQALASFRRLLAWTTVAGLGLAAVGGWLLAARALGPVDAITATAAAIAADDRADVSLAARLAVPESRDEVARLAMTFNEMLDRLQGTFATQRRFVADASHELRSPLTAIRGNVDVLALQHAREHPDGGAQDTTDALVDVRRESDRMARLLDDLLLLARADAPDAPRQAAVGAGTPVRLDQVAADAARTAEAMANGQPIVLNVAAVAVNGDADRLRQVVLILLDNALRHTPPGGEVRVDVDPPRRGTARLTVTDTGEGIAPEHLPHVFERFYRADGTRSRATGGTGLGLAIARAIVRGHGGEIALQSRLGVGTVATVDLPASAHSPDVPVDAAAPAMSTDSPGATEPVSSARVAVH